MMGDRVLSEEVDKTSQVYSEEKVESIFKDREQKDRKSRDRDRGDNNINPPKNPPPLKRRKIYKLTPKQFSLDQALNTVCEEKLPEAARKDLKRVSPDCTSPAMMTEQRQQSPSSHSNKTSFHSVFDKAHGLGGANRTFRKFKKKVKDIPPPS